MNDEKLINLDEIKPTIIIDSREQTPLEFSNKFPTEIGNLFAGDYSIKHLEPNFTIERKSINDLVGSTIHDRARFERQLHRMGAYRFARLIVTGHRSDVEAGRYYSNAAPRSVLNSVDAFEVRHGVPVVWAGSADRAARLVEKWVHWFCREIAKNYSKLSRGVA